MTTNIVVVEDKQLQRISLTLSPKSLFSSRIGRREGRSLECNVFVARRFGQLTVTHARGLRGPAAGNAHLGPPARFGRTFGGRGCGGRGRRSGDEASSRGFDTIPDPGDLFSLGPDDLFLLGHEHRGHASHGGLALLEWGDVAVVCLTLFLGRRWGSGVAQLS